MRRFLFKYQCYYSEVQISHWIENIYLRAIRTVCRIYDESRGLDVPDLQYDSKITGYYGIGFGKA